MRGFTQSSVLVGDTRLDKAIDNGHQAVCLNKEGRSMPEGLRLCCHREEMWRIIPDLPGYAVSNLGRVRREAGGSGAQAGRILQPVRRASGHLYVCLPPNSGERLRNTSGGSSNSVPFLVHRLVAAAWLPGVPDSWWKDKARCIHHKDGNPLHNCDLSLCWQTRTEHRNGHLNSGEPLKGRLWRPYYGPTLQSDPWE
jgi:hypothetical protein